MGRHKVGLPVLLLGLAGGAVGVWGPPGRPAAGPEQRVQPRRGWRALGLGRRERPVPAALGYRKRRALVVGVSRYAPPVPDLLDGAGQPIPARDAAAVAAVLASRFGFEVTLLADGPPSPGPARVTGAALRAALRRLEAAGEGQALVFYFAGHGARRGPRGYLVPADGRPSAPRTLLDLAEASALLRAAGAHHTLVALDCCFSGVALEPNSGVEAAVRAGGG